MADEGREQLARLKKLADDLDAARNSVDETVKHIESAKHRADRLVSNDAGVIDASNQRKRLTSKRNRNSAKKAKRARRRR